MCKRNFKGHLLKIESSDFSNYNGKIIDLISDIFVLFCTSIPYGSSWEVRTLVCAWLDLGFFMFRGAENGRLQNCTVPKFRCKMVH